MSELVAVQLETLAAELKELRAICAQLVRDNAELRDRLENPTTVAKSTPRELAPSSGHVISRRGVMTKALGAAAVTVVGGAALVNRDALPAAASNGANVIAGNQTTAEARTSVLYDGAAGFGGVVLLGNDSTYSGSSAGYPAGLGGWAGAGATAGKGGVANGVYGFTDNGNGNGVVGVNSGLVAGSGAGVLGTASGAKNAAVQGHNSQGTAVSGTSDSTGVRRHRHCRGDQQQRPGRVLLGTARSKQRHRWPRHRYLGVPRRVGLGNVHDKRERDRPECLRRDGDRGQRLRGNGRSG